MDDFSTEFSNNAKLVSLSLADLRNNHKDALMRKKMLLTVFAIEGALNAITQKTQLSPNSEEFDNLEQTFQEFTSKGSQHTDTPNKNSFAKKLSNIMSKIDLIRHYRAQAIEDNQIFILDVSSESVNDQDEVIYLVH